MLTGGWWKSGVPAVKPAGSSATTPGWCSACRRSTTAPTGLSTANTALRIAQRPGEPVTTQYAPPSGGQGHGLRWVRSSNLVVTYMSTEGRFKPDWIKAGCTTHTNSYVAISCYKIFTPANSWVTVFQYLTHSDWGVKEVWLTYLTWHWFKFCLIMMHFKLHFTNYWPNIVAQICLELFRYFPFTLNYMNTTNFERHRYLYIFMLLQPYLHFHCT